jgi:hypothetical protein
MSLIKIVAKAASAAGLTLALVGLVKANEIKGKVSIQGIKSAENIAVYVDTIPDNPFSSTTLVRLLSYATFTRKCPATSSSFPHRTLR